MSIPRSTPTHVTICQSRLYSPVRDLRFGLLSKQWEKRVTVWGGRMVIHVCPWWLGVLEGGFFYGVWGGKHEAGGGRCMCIVHCADSSPTRPGRFTLMTEGRRGTRVVGLYLKIILHLTDLCTRTMMTFFSVSELIPWTTPRPWKDGEFFLRPLHNCFHALDKGGYILQK